MADLKDFADKPQAESIDQFIIDTSKRSVGNNASNVNLAAQMTALSSTEEVENSYRSNLNLLEQGGQASDKPDIQLARDDKKELAETTLLDMMASPEISDQTKQMMANTFVQGTFATSSVPKMVQQESLSLDLDLNTLESDSVRANTADVIGEVNDYNAFKQQIINLQESKGDTGFWNGLGNLGELIVPFAESKQVGDISKALRNSGMFNPDELSGRIGSTFLMGSSKENIKEALAAMPIDKRMEAVRIIADVVDSNKSILFSDDNDMARMHNLRSILEDGYAGNWSIAIDNVVGVLDLFGVFGMVKVAIRGVAKVSNMSRQAIRGAPSPSSVARIYTDTNPDKARAVNNLASKNEEASLATHGLNKTDAVADMHLPEIGLVDETVALKTHDPNDVRREVQEFLEGTDGAIRFDETERTAMRLTVLEKFQAGLNQFDEALNMRSRGEMNSWSRSSAEANTDGVTVRSIFGPRDTGYLDPQEALELAEFTFRDLGVTNFQLLKRTADGYTPVAKTTTEGGDYLIGVKYNYKFDPNDNLKAMQLDVKRNWFDRIAPISSSELGSFTRHLFSPQDTLHPILTMSANVAADKTVGLQKIIERHAGDWGNIVAKFNKADRGVVYNQIVKNNAESLPLDLNKMKADGFTPAMIDSMNKWKEMQDAIYHLDNLDLAKTLRGQGFKAFEDVATDTQIFAKAVGEINPALKDGVRVFDYESNTTRFLTHDEIKTIYEEGGTLAQMRNKVNKGDDVAEYIISREQNGSSYLRTINDGDSVLNYREGYYQIHYKDPWFIDKFVDGVKVATVATARNTKDAELMVSRLGKSVDADEVGVTFVKRGDIKSVDRLGLSHDLAISQGRSSQRVRGQALEQSTSHIQPNATNILDPLESLEKSISSVARRAQMRDWLTTAQNRFMQQYGDLLRETDNFGQPAWPSSRKAIAGADAKVSSRQADAITTWEYINYMQNGYSNSIDDAYKAIMHGMSDMLGEKGLSVLEEAGRTAAKVNIPSEMKGIAFKLYLALNPLRQVLVQSHQGVRLIGYAPKYTTTRMTQDIAVLMNGMAGNKMNKVLLKAAGRTEKEAADLIKQFTNSGLYAAVDSNNLVKNAGAKLADLTIWEKSRKAVGTPIRVAQKVGFDLGEQLNIASAWLTFHNEAKMAGKAMNATDLDEVGALARNWTYNMNTAGDMPYNQNVLSVALQFMQVPHKAFLANITNRNISRSVRARMAIFDTVMWGVPIGTLTAMGLDDALPDDPAMRRVISNGIEELLLNTVLSAAVGRDVSLDLSSLAPGDLHGMNAMMGEMLNGSLTDIIAKSPSGQLFFGGNGRITNFARDLAQFTSVIDNDLGSITELQDVGISFIKMSSGMSHAFKVDYILKWGRKMNSKGQVVANDLGIPEAVAQAFGLGTIAEAQKMQAGMAAYAHSVALKDDVTQWYTQAKRLLSNEDLTAQQVRQTMRLTSEAWRVWGNIPEARKQLKKLMKKDAVAKDTVLYRSLRKLLNGGLEPSELKTLILDSGMEQSKIDTLMGFVGDAQAFGNKE